MGRQEEIVKERLKKINELKNMGVEPYPYHYEPKDSAGSLHEKFKKLKNEEHDAYKAKIAGRLIGFRDMGNISFGVVQDESGRIQIVLQKGTVPEKLADFFKKYVDIGDFIGVEGTIFRTKRGEISVLVKKTELLSKSLTPLPEKWHGLQDKEERYRKRYVDLIMNPDVRSVFDKREKIIDAIRAFMKERGFHETDTPTLQSVYGGANARPFKTHLNSLDIDLYLSISPELYLKRLIVGGYEKVFTIARNFRNEGIDRWHNPEFTMMEVYQAYADYNDMMELFEDLYVHVAKQVNGTTKITFRGKELELKKPWKKLTMVQAIKKYGKIDVEKMTDKELFEIVDKHKIECKEKSWGYAVEGLFKHFCEANLEEPVFIIDHPIETTPLCKIHRKDKEQRLIERFEPYCMGAELGNAYSELNNPVLQRSLLEEQQQMLSKGDEEANPYDEDFVNALEIGMPPTGGLGVGIDRMVMLLTGQDSIRDVILFPFMKPEKEEKHG